MCSAGMDNKPDVRSALANRLLDEGVLLVVKAALAEGITISSKTALRWCLSGTRGVRLESLKIGGRRMTSRPAMRRFIATTQDRPANSGSVPECRVPCLDRDAADRILAAHGLGEKPAR